MRAAITRSTLAFTLAGVLGAFSTYGCFGGKALTDPTNVNPGTGFRPPQSQIAVVTLSPSSISGKPGDSTQITATMKDSSGAIVTDSAVAWTSTDSTVATVSANGRVKFWHRGRSWIGIRVGGLTDSVPTTVVAQSLATIQLSPTAISGVPGSSTQITAVLKDSTGALMTTPPTLSWSSSNTSIATVSSGGLVSLTKQGSATITASSSGVTSTVKATVTAPPVGPVATIALSPRAITGVPGNTTQVTAALSDASGNPVTGVTVTWSSSSTGVATVSASGLVTLVKQGTASITASASGVTATIGATVSAAPVASIGLTPTSISGVAGSTTQVTAVPKDASGNTVSGQTVSWTSSNASAANVSSGGLVTLIKQGTATITASDGSISATLGVTVSAPAIAAIMLAPATVSGVPGNAMQLTATAQDASGNPISGAAMTWSSSSSATASVSSSGMVTLVKQGTATVTVASGGKTATAAVTVNPAAAPAVASVSVSPTTASLTTGQSVQLTATADDASGNVITGAAVSWSSSSAGEATVSATGLVQALTAGTVIITATSGGHVATANVKVTAATTPPASGAGGANEPAGMQQQLNTGGITSLSDSHFTVTAGGGLSVVPGGTGWRITYTSSLEGGNAPVVFSTTDFANPGTGWLYQRFKIRFSTNFTASSNSGLKLNEPRTNYPGGGDDATENHVMYVSAWDVSPTRLSLALGLQGPNGHFADVNPQPASNPAAVLSTGDNAWHTVEIVFGPESTPGAGNGVYQSWVDGTQVANYSNIVWLAAGQTPGWPRIAFVPTYGGGTASPPATMYWDMDQLYVSTK
jgi:uncharacterized protein YjdB